MPLALTNQTAASLKGLAFKETKSASEVGGTTFYSVSDANRQPVRFYCRATPEDCGVESTRIGYMMKGERRELIKAHAKAYAAACKGKGGFQGLKHAKDSQKPAWSDPFPVSVSLATSGKGAFYMLDKAVDAAFFKSYGHVLDNLERKQPAKAEYANRIDLKFPSATYHTYITNTDQDVDIPKLMTSKMECSMFSFTVTGVSVRQVFDTETEAMVSTYSICYKIDMVYNLPGLGKGLNADEKESVPIDPVSFEDMQSYIEDLYSDNKPKNKPGKKRAKQEIEEGELVDEIEAAMASDAPDPAPAPAPKKKKKVMASRASSSHEEGPIHEV